MHDYLTSVMSVNSSPSYVAFGDQHFSLAGLRRVEGVSANVRCPETLFLINSVYTNNVFNGRVQL